MEHKNSILTISGFSKMQDLENNFEKGVGVHMPKALKPYLNFDLIEIVK